MEEAWRGPKHKLRLLLQAEHSLLNVQSNIQCHAVPKARGSIPLRFANLEAVAQQAERGR